MGDAGLGLVAERLRRSADAGARAPRAPARRTSSGWSLKYQTVKTKSQSWRARSIRGTPRATPASSASSAVRCRSARPQVQCSDSERTRLGVSQRQLLGDDPAHRCADDVGALDAERAGGRPAATSAKSSERVRPAPAQSFARPPGCRRRSPGRTASGSRSAAPRWSCRRRARRRGARGRPRRAPRSRRGTRRRQRTASRRAGRVRL